MATTRSKGGSDDGNFSTDGDNIWGHGGADTIHGEAGDDWIKAGDGADSLLGGNAGHDTLYGGDGADSIHGDAGSDSLFANNAGNTDDNDGDNMWGDANPTTSPTETRTGTSLQDRYDGAFM